MKNKLELLDTAQVWRKGKRMEKANVITTQENADFITDAPNKKIDELVKQGHAVVTQTSADLFGSDKVESVNHLELLTEKTEPTVVVEHDGKFANTQVRYGTFMHDTENNIIGIHGRTLKVIDLSDSKETYFQAWVDGYQNDGLSHNEAVKNALKFAKENRRSN